LRRLRGFVHRGVQRAERVARVVQRVLSFGRRGLSLTLTGLAVGLVLAAMASRLMTTLLYGVRPDYLPTVAVVSLILVGVAAMACFVPARRASHIDPMIALRHE
jgi:ABC-type antimicrobial peptide transport system permease subunit